MKPVLDFHEQSALFDLRRALTHWPPGLKVSVSRGALVVRKGRVEVARWVGVGETKVTAEAQVSG